MDNPLCLFKSPGHGPGLHDFLDLSGSEEVLGISDAALNG